MPQLHVVRRAVLGVAIAAVMVFLPNGYGVADPQTTTAATPIRGAGKWFTDSSGRVVVFHGENVANKRPPYLPSATGFGAPDAQLLADEGFNAVRMPIMWEAVEPQPGRYDDGYLADIASTVGVLHDHGIGVEIEFHQDLWSSAIGGEGAPPWATLTNGAPDTSHDLVAANLGNPAFWNATENFFANAPGPDGIGIQTRFLRMWQHVAAYFKGKPGVVGYGPLNQPPAGPAFLPCLANVCPPPIMDSLRAFNRNVSDAIRSTDPDTPIWLSGIITTNYGTTADLGAPPVGNTVYGFNVYCVVQALQGGGSGGCDPQWKSDVNQAEVYSGAVGIPPVVTEFGATGDRGALVGNLDLFDQGRLGWFNWTYLGGDPATVAKNPDDQAIVVDAHLPRTPGNVRESNLDALVRPYPKLTSGTPIEWNYNVATQEFTYRWDTGRADGGGRFPDGAITVISAPHRPYPGGYHVRIAGGRQVSGQNAADLRIAACPGAGQVSVTIMAGGGPDQSGC
ncbi:cellulase family glycosylhydrolase [Nocardia arthritidis]|uniref:Cellulase family glycosylhydrolase n=1 Tax=Nocardia arthritidis TaxID=228602 RepID=A0A6G9YLL3_9NOCA|nr:cellulase family glycosylhydrolase [Nocardia arthritidis]QIS14092.1 cellulase family glycosylhydrolase [Nocardia arthritidis]